MAAINTACFVLLLSAVAYGTEELHSPKLLLCNIDVSSAMRSHVGNFTPEQLDPQLCTHVIYNKARIEGETRNIISSAPSIDLYDKGGLGMYNRTMKLKVSNPQLKVILQVCCFGASFWDNETMSYDVIISTFIKNAVTYMEHYGFDGLYVTMNSHPEEIRLWAALREEFDKRGFLLMTFLLPVEIPTNQYAELTPENSRFFDAIILGEYWRMNEENTTIFSPLNTLRSGISHSKQYGLPVEKMVVSIPTFALCYKLCNASDTGVSAPICAGGDEGQTQDTEMVLIYSEMMFKMKNASEGWVVQRDEESGMLYGHSNSLLWTSFEDPISVRAKVQFALEENLAGVAMMSVDMDDYMGYNEEGVILPLTRAAHDALRGN